MCVCRLTSACDPADSVLLHFSHFRQGLCQSFPSDVTLSAVRQRDKQTRLANGHGPLTTTCILPHRTECHRYTQRGALGSAEGMDTVCDLQGHTGAALQRNCELHGQTLQVLPRTSTVLISLPTHTDNALLTRTLGGCGGWLSL